jgi:hypothetical protein
MDLAPTKFICWKCERENEQTPHFESAPVAFLRLPPEIEDELLRQESPPGENIPYTWSVKCCHCGTINEVELKLSSEEWQMLQYINAVWKWYG